MIKDSYKLFLESYFEVVVCSTINVIAFINYRDDFKSFFSTVSDAICSIITIVFSALVLLFPIVGFKLIHQY